MEPDYEAQDEYDSFYDRLTPAEEQDEADYWNDQFRRGNL